MKLNQFDEQTLRRLANGMELPTDFKQLDALAAQFHADVLPAGMGFGPRDFWEALKIEFHKFVCGPEDGKADSYTELRKVVAQQGSRSQHIIVGTIAAFIGAHIGLEAGAIIPWIALLIGLVSKIGLEAFCRAANEHSKKRQPQKTSPT